MTLSLPLPLPLSLSFPLPLPAVAFISPAGPPPAGVISPEARSAYCTINPSLICSIVNVGP